MADRPCGDCSVCCTYKLVDAPGFTKPPGVMCEHCLSPGCGVYETRHEVCRTYRCAWKFATWLPEDMRPDRSGVVIDFQDSDLPGRELEATVLAFSDGGDFERNPVPDVIASLIDNGVLVRLARSGPPGLLDAQAVANGALDEAVRTRNVALLLTELRAGVRVLENSPRAPFRPTYPDDPA